LGALTLGARRARIGRTGSAIAIVAGILAIPLGLFGSNSLVNCFLLRKFILALNLLTDRPFNAGQLNFFDNDIAPYRHGLVSGIILDIVWNLPN
jgi:hypothetical protein